MRSAHLGLLRSRRLWAVTNRHFFFPSAVHLVEQRGRGVTEAVPAYRLPLGRGWSRSARHHFAVRASAGAASRVGLPAAATCWLQPCREAGCELGSSAGCWRPALRGSGAGTATRSPCGRACFFFPVEWGGAFGTELFDRKES